MMNRIFQFDEDPTSSDDIPAKPTQLFSSFYFRKKHLSFIQQYPDGTTVRLSGDDVISVLKAERAFDDQRNLDQFFYDLRHSHAVDYDGPLPGYRLGLHIANGQSLFCSSAAKPVLAVDLHQPDNPGGDGSGADSAEASSYGQEPMERGWPVIAELLRRLLVTPESGDIQRLTLLAHLKVAHATLLDCLEEPDPSKPAPKRNVRPQQALAICGPVASGRTFLFEHVIAPILGNRVVDAFKAFCASAEGFTGELLNGEVWKIDDHAGSTRQDMRRTFAANIKSYLFSGNVSIHPKKMTPSPWLLTADFSSSATMRTRTCWSCRI